MTQPTLVAVAREAMATRFEIVLYGARPAALRAAGEEALDEIERLEARLSLFRPTSEIANVNAEAHLAPVKVSVGVYNLLKLAQRMCQETGGAFDISISPLMHVWGFRGGADHSPAPEALALARARVGMAHVHLDDANYTVRFDRPGVMLDLGAVGKGYAVEQAVMTLREAGVESALVHGGTSTVAAIGHPPDQDAWAISIDLPASRNAPPSVPVAIVPLMDGALSVSAVWGRCFRVGDKMLGHIIDPRTGEPAARAILSAIALPSATESDALSTALLVLGSEGQGMIQSLRPGMRTLVASAHEGDGFPRISATGIPLLPNLPGAAEFAS